jgi:hypothetical protein
MTQQSRPEQLLADLLDVEAASPEPMSEYYKLELEQVVKRIESLETVRFQLGTFFGTANLTALGFAFSTRRAILFLIAAAILGAYAIVDDRARALRLVFYYRGLQLQRRFAHGDPDTFLQLLPTQLAVRARAILAMPERKARMRALRAKPRSFYFWFNLTIIALEVALGFTLWLAGWVLW